MCIILYYVWPTAVCGYSDRIYIMKMKGESGIESKTHVNDAINTF